MDNTHSITELPDDEARKAIVAPKVDYNAGQTGPITQDASGSSLNFSSFLQSELVWRTHGQETRREITGEA
jgi:hypothetical protein